MRYIPTNDPEKNLNDSLRKFTLDKLLSCINSESSTFFKESEDKGQVFGVKYVKYPMCNVHTGQIKELPVYVTGWNLIDLSYRAVLATNDYRGIPVIDAQSIYFLVSLSTEVSAKHEKELIKNMDETSNTDMMFYLWGFFGEQRRIQTPANVFDSAARELYILFDVATKHSMIDVANIVYEEVGVNWKAVLTTIYLLWFGSTVSPYILPLKEELKWSELLSEKEFDKTLNYYTTDYKTIKESPLERQILYTKPFVKTERTKEIISVNCFLNMFLYEHSIMWIARNHYLQKGQYFVDEFGRLFEKYFEEILSEYVESQNYSRIPESEEKRADWRIKIAGYNFLVEQKSALISLSAKQQESDISSIKKFFIRNVIKAMKQLEITENHFNDGKYIKIILLYEDYIEAEILDSVFNMPECKVKNDNYYWIMTITEMEMILHTYKTDLPIFKEVISEKIRLEEERSIEGRSILKQLTKNGIDENQHLKQDKFAKYYEVINKEAISLLIE